MRASAPVITLTALFGGSVALAGDPVKGDGPDQVEASGRSDGGAAVVDGGVVEGGVEGGVVAGVEGGVVRGLAFSGPFPGPRVVSPTDLRVKRVVQPEFPRSARSLGLAPVDCRVRVFIGANGRATETHFVACPALFHDSTREAVEATRWWPYRESGEVIPVQTTLRFLFVEPDEPPAPTP